MLKSILRHLRKMHKNSEYLFRQKIRKYDHLPAFERLEKQRSMLENRIGQIQKEITSIGIAIKK